MEKEELKYHYHLNRRHFLSKASLGLGGLGLASLLSHSQLLGRNKPDVSAFKHIAPKAKRVIYLFQSGGPSQLELFDYKPKLNEMRGQDLPESIRNGQRLTGMTSGQDSFPLAGSLYDFEQYGQSGARISSLLPYTSQVADDICIIRSMHTEAINHDPAITFFQTGSQQPGRPSMGSWLSYGLGSDNANLPAFTVLLSRGTGRPQGQPLFSPLWGNG